MSFNHEPIPGIHPILNFCIALIIVFFGIHIPEISILMHLRIPPGIIDFFQCLAYSGTGVIGFIAAYKFNNDTVKPYWKKRKSNYKKPKK